MSVERDDMKGIKRAALTIAYDNGAINRDQTEEMYINELEEWWDAWRMFPAMKVINDWLESLPEEHLDLICTGEDSEASALLASLGAPPNTSDLLNNIFEQVG